MNLQAQMKLAGDEANAIVREIEQIEADVTTVWNDRLMREVPKYTKAMEARLTRLRRRLKDIHNAQDALMNRGLFK